MGAPRPNISRPATPGGRVRGGKGSKSEHFSPRTVRLVDGRRIKFAAARSVGDRIRKLADVQRGRISREQLLASGIKPSAITRRLHSGDLEPVHRGVYALPNTAEIPLAPETAALLACGEGAVLSHHSAVTLWGLRPGTARPIHVTIDGRRGCPKPQGVNVHRSRTLLPADGRTCRGLPITSPARTLLDAAATLPDRDVERMLDRGTVHAPDPHAKSGPGSALTRRRSSGAANPGPRGGRIHPLNPDRLSARRKAPSADSRRRPSRTPAPEITVLDYRLDFFWPGLKLAVEVDAYGTHGSRTRFEADRRRDARLLTERGITVLRLTKSAIEQRPWEAIGLLARAIGQREALLAA